MPLFFFLFPLIIMSHDYPAKQFTEGFASPSEALLSEVDEHNKAGARPGKQSTLKEVRSVAFAMMRGTS